MPCAIRASSSSLAACLATPMPLSIASMVTWISLFPTCVIGIQIELSSLLNYLVSPSRENPHFLTRMLCLGPQLDKLLLGFIDWISILLISVFQNSFCEASLSFLLFSSSSCCLERQADIRGTHVVHSLLAGDLSPASVHLSLGQCLG